jgi:hypothetical protein
LECATVTIGILSNSRLSCCKQSLFTWSQGWSSQIFFGETSIDLKESFYSHRRWFFFLGFAVIVVSVCKALVLDGKLPSQTNLTFHGIFGVTLLVGASTKNEPYHKALVIFTIAVFLLYIVLLYARME